MHGFTVSSYFEALFYNAWNFERIRILQSLKISTSFMNIFKLGFFSVNREGIIKNE